MWGCDGDSNEFENYQCNTYKTMFVAQVTTIVVMPWHISKRNIFNRAQL